VRISFDVVGKPAEFRWNPVTGGTTLEVDGHPVQLQSGLDPRTHFTLSTSRRWQQSVDGHVVVMTMTRPQLLAGFRRKDFTVEVDGGTVATTYGF
jgi:hypothetical protein